MPLLPNATDLNELIPEEWVDNNLIISSLEQWTKEIQIGNGHFGAVYKYKTAEDITVAGKHLKRIYLYNLNDEGKNSLRKRLELFSMELNLLHKVSTEFSELFVQVIGCFWDAKKIILFTEYMSQGSIKNHIVDEPLEEKVALKYFYQIAKGLNCLHHRKPRRIVHRDIKCDNLLLTENFTVKLADFGLAQYLEVDNQSQTMSNEFGCVGTTLYLAPEVLKGENYGRGADIWSLACTLVEMLTKEPPHADFMKKYKDRATFLFYEKAKAEPADQLTYSGNYLVPESSGPLRKLLTSIFVKNKQQRPTIDDILDVLVPAENADQIHIDAQKLTALQAKYR